jgi:hypothetical protein
MDVNEIYRTLLSHKTEIDSLLHTIEESNSTPSIAIQQRLSWLTTEFGRLLDTLKSETRKFNDVKSKGMWDIRVSRFTEDLNVIRVSCDRRLGLLFKSQREKEDRELLFAGSNKGSSNDSQLLSESRSLYSSHNMMDTITDQSRAILDRIVGQNSTLKTARGKMFDLINNAGAGSNLAGSIVSREKVDAIIVYGCMAFTILLFFLLWYFVK